MKHKPRQRHAAWTGSVRHKAYLALCFIAAAGRLAVQMPVSTPVRSSVAPNRATGLQPPSTAAFTDAPSNSAYGSWLAANANLLHSLALLDPSTPEQPVAQGIHAAAAAAGRSDCSGSSASASDTCSDLACLLPLRSLTCHIPISGAILHSMLSAQLTSLWLRLALPPDNYWRERPYIAPLLVESLAGLTSLQEMTLVVHAPSSKMIDSGVPRTCDGAVSHEVLPAVQQLTRLTRLNLMPDMDANCSDRQSLCSLCLPDTHGHLLPGSLVRLDVPVSRSWPYVRDVHRAHALDLGHLTAITALKLLYPMGEDVLPPNTERLSLHECTDTRPLLGGKLPSLRQLLIDNSAREDDPIQPYHLRRLQQLSQLQELQLRLWFYDDDLFPVISSLAALPLTEFEACYYGEIPVEFLSSIGCFSKLTRLSLTQRWNDCYESEGPDTHWGPAAVGALASQLPQLSALQELQLHTLPAGTDAYHLLANRATEADWEGLLQAMARLPSLWHAEMSLCGVGTAALKLAGATQLTRLVLRNCGLKRDCATKMALRSGLKHLMPDALTRLP